MQLAIHRLLRTKAAQHKKYNHHIKSVLKHINLLTNIKTPKHIRVLQTLYE